MIKIKPIKKDWKSLVKIERLFIFLCFLFAVNGCEKEEEEQSSVKKITVVFPPNSIGDKGYYDKILQGVAMFEKQGKENVKCEILTSNDKPTMIDHIQNWYADGIDNEEEGNTNLLVVTDPIVVDDVAFPLSSLPKGNDILLFSDEKTYSRYKGFHVVNLNEYSVSYRAGYEFATAKNLKLPPVKIQFTELNRSFEIINEGFSDGFHAASSLDMECFYVPKTNDDLEIIENISSAVLNVVADDYQFEKCIFVLLEEYQNVFLSCALQRSVVFVGIDIPVKDYVSCALSINRHYDVLMNDLLTKWYNDNNLPCYIEYGEDSKYIEYEKSPYFFEEE